MTGQEVEVLSGEARRAVAWWTASPNLPAAYIGKQGVIDVEGLRLAAFALQRLDVDPFDTLGDTFVITDSYGRKSLGFKADLQRALLTRHPGYDFEVLEVDDEHIVARLRTPSGWKTPLTKKLTDRDMVVYAARGAKDGEEINANYRDKPRRMLEARITTELIDLYAKGVLRGIVAQAAPDVLLIDTPDEDAALRAVEGRLRATAPDGTTIPEHLREPEVTDEVRAELLAKLGRLSDESRQSLNHKWFVDLHAPNPKTNRFTKAHGELLSRLIVETGPPEIPGPAQAENPPPDEPPPGSSPAAGPGPTVDRETGEILDQPPLYGPDEEPF